MVPIFELKVSHPRKPLTRRPTKMAGHPTTGIRGCLLCVERFTRKHLRPCPSQLHARPFREKVNPTGPRGHDGVRQPHTCTENRSRKWENGGKRCRGAKIEEENDKRHGSPSQFSAQLDPSRWSQKGGRGAGQPMHVS